MKKFALLLGCVAVVSQVQNVSAKTLEDVLQEKGIITAEDYKSVTKSKPIDYKLGEGFTFTSPDEKFRTTIGSCLQLRYTLMDLDDVNNTAAKQAVDSSKFELKRIKLYFNGYAYSKDLTYKLQMNFANINGGATSNGGLLEETWMNYRLLDEVQFRFGQDKVQFGRQFITSSAMQQFVDQSVVTNAFVPGYDTGLMVHGKVAGGLFNYNVAGYGGLGQNTYRATTDNAFAARLAINPLGDLKYAESDVEDSAMPLLSLGGNFYRNTVNAAEQNTSTVTTNNQLNFNSKGKGWFAIGNPLSATAKQIAATESVDYNTAGFDAAFKWHGFSAQAEYFQGRADGQTSRNTAKSQGFYAQTGFFVIPKTLEVAARYSYIDPNRDAANDLWTETTAAVSWYINNHNLKVQTDYTAVHKQKGIASTSGAHATDDNQVRLQAQLIF
jgi:phosphate-selective porin OprO and OprP